MSHTVNGSAGLFDHVRSEQPKVEHLTEGAVLLRGFALRNSVELVANINNTAQRAAFRHMVTPGGRRMSVAMTNCGQVGWVSDRSGYRYSSTDPDTGLPWPAMPPAFLHLATTAADTAGFLNFLPDACLINRYEPGTKLTLHQDRDERDFTAPIVSVSLGLPATFLFGGAKRSDRPRRLRLENGDVAVWGGSARLFYHGIAPLADGEHPLTGRYRMNLTFRKAL